MAEPAFQMSLRHWVWWALGQASRRFTEAVVGLQLTARTSMLHRAPQALVSIVSLFFTVALSYFLTREGYDYDQKTSASRIAQAVVVRFCTLTLLTTLPQVSFAPSPCSGRERGSQRTRVTISGGAAAAHARAQLHRVVARAVGGAGERGRRR